LAFSRQLGPTLELSVFLPREFSFNLTGPAWTIPEDRLSQGQRDPS